MTTRIKGFTVILENEMREDEVKYIVNAMRMIKGVQQVTPVEHHSSDHITEMKTQQEIASKLMEFIDKEL